MSFDHSSFDRIVAALQQDAPRYFDGRTVSHIGIEETIPRPYSQLARILIRSTSGDERAYIKLYRHPKLGDPHNSSSARREHDAHARLYEAFEGVEGYGVVRPIAAFPDLGGWVMEAVEGRTLEQELSRKGHRWAGRQSQEALQQMLCRAGAWLRHLHREFRQEDSISLAESGVLAEIDDLLTRTAELDQEDVARVRARVERLVRQQKDMTLPVVGQHGECYAPHHIFVRNGDLLVFDITGIKFGPEYEDLSNLWVGLEALLKYPVFSRSDIGNLQASLLDGFAESGELQVSAFEIYKIKNMLQLLDSLSRISVTNWRSGIRKLIGLRFVRCWILDRV